MPGEASKTYLCARLGRASRWVYFEILPGKGAQGTQAFLGRLAAACPFKIEKILTDNGKEFTGRFTAQGERQPTGNHPFDQGCKAIGAEHRLIPPRHPRPAAWPSASTGASPSCWQAPASTPPPSWPPPWATTRRSIMSAFPSAPWAISPRFRPSRHGAKKSQSGLLKRYIILRDLTFATFRHFVSVGVIGTEDFHD